MLPAMDTDTPVMVMATDTAKLVTAEEAGRLVGVSARTIRRWIQRGILQAVATDDGQRVVPADLPTAKSAAGGHGHGHGRGHRRAVVDTVTDTDMDMDMDTTVSVSTPATVSPAAVAQLEAIRDQWLRPLMDRNEDLARENGRLAAERDAAARERDRAQEQLDADRSLADQLVDLLQAERDAALAEVARLSEIPSTPAAPVTVSNASPAATPAPWWRFWDRR